MANKSGRKGKGYERKIAKILSEWSGIELIRTPMSGAWQGTAGDIATKRRGDVTSFPFTVECKNDESWHMSQLFEPSNGPFTGWLDQAFREAKQDSESTGIKCIPLLIFSRNYRPDFVVFMEPRVGYYAHCRMQVTYEQSTLVVMLLDEFIETVDFEGFKSIHNLTQDNQE